jgi:hypothetical protein
LLKRDVGDKLGFKGHIDKSTQKEEEEKQYIKRKFLKEAVKKCLDF